MRLLWHLLSSASVLEKIVASVVAAVIGTILFGFVRYLNGLTREWKNNRSVDQDLYTPEDTKAKATSQKIYVLPDCQDNDPSHGSPALNRRPLFQEITKLLGPPPQARLILVLADSGMGKSSFLLNYYVYHWRRRARNKHFRLAMVPLVQLNVNEFIKSIPLRERSGTVLFLDGLDEDPAAGRDFKQRSQELVEIASQFRCVVITCRSQFLPEALTGANFEGKARPLGGAIGLGGGPDLTVRYLYLSQFSDAQVKRYLAARFPRWRFPVLRVRAARAALRFSELVVRPLLLSYIEDLADERSTPKSAFQVYEIIVDKWLQREVNDKGIVSDKGTLLRFCEELAGELFRSGRDRVPKLELESLANVHPVKPDTREVKERSLLHHDSEGNWKFAHRSIMEYLVVKQCSVAPLGPTSCPNRPWTNQMRSFAREMLVSGKCKRLVGADLRDIDLHGVNLSGVDLRWTNLADVDFHDARLDGAHLAEARGLTLSQILKARSSGSTIWPCWLPFRHAKPINCCAVSPQGDFVVSGSDDTTLKVWDLTTGRERLTLSGHMDVVWACVVSVKADFIVSSSEDGTLKVWDVATGTERVTLSGHTSGVDGCAVSRKGDFIVSASSDKTLKVWDVATGRERFTLSGHRDWVSGCAVSPQGDFIVSASKDKTLKIWDSATGKERLNLVGHTDWVRCCAVAPQGDLIVSGSEDGTLAIWDVATGKRRRTVSSGQITSCALGPQGDFIVAASLADKRLRVWEVATGTIRHILSGHADQVECCAVSPQGNLIVSASKDKTLKIWEVATGKERLIPSGHAAGVESCAVGPQGDFIVSASIDKTLGVWETATPTMRHVLSGHVDRVNCCAVSPQGDFIVSASSDKTLKLWDVATRKERLTFTGHEDSVTSCAVSSKGTFIASGSDDTTIRVWNAQTGEERLTLESETDGISNIGGQTVRVLACAISSNDNFIVSASSDRSLRVWDVATGRERLILSGHSDAVNSCAVSPECDFIVSASNDKTLKIWDVITGKERLTLHGHEAGVHACTVSPRGNAIVSASADNTIRVWDVATGKELLVLEGHSDAVTACALSPDGDFIVSASMDCRTVMWFSSATKKQGRKDEPNLDYLRPDIAATLGTGL